MALPGNRRKRTDGRKYKIKSQKYALTLIGRRFFNTQMKVSDHFLHQKEVERIASIVSRYGPEIKNCSVVIGEIFGAKVIFTPVKTEIKKDCGKNYLFLFDDAGESYSAAMFDLSEIHKVRRSLEIQNGLPCNLNG